MMMMMMMMMMVRMMCTWCCQERVVGFHVLGPNAGEITQGWTVGLKLHATKADFDNAIGIHPTCAEVVYYCLSVCLWLSVCLYVSLYDGEYWPL